MKNRSASDILRENIYCHRVVCFRAFVCIALGLRRYALRVFLFLEEIMKSFTKFELGLWAVSVSVVTASFIIGGNFRVLTLIASLIGVTALIFVAKGDVTGQVLTVVFSVLYSVISFEFTYYGEMITYMFMTAPIAAMSVYTWIRHPEEKGKREVSIARLSLKKTIMLYITAVIVTVIFYFILRYFNNANLFFSTVTSLSSGNWCPTRTGRYR